MQPLSQNDLLVKDENGTIYRVGRSSSCQIVATQIRIERGPAIATNATNLVLDDEDLYTAVVELPQERTYLSGTLTIFDAEDLTLPTHLDRFDTITIKPGSDIAYARLTSASPLEVMSLLGDYYASGNLIVRTLTIQQL